MKERRWRKGDRFSGRDIFEKEMAERIGLLVYLENDDLRRLGFKQLVHDRPLNIAPTAGQGEIDQVGVLRALREILLDGGGAKTKLSARGTQDGDVDRRGVKVDPLVDPAHPSIRVLQLPSLIAVFRKEADRRVEYEGDSERRQDRDDNFAYGCLSPRKSCCLVEDHRVRFRLRSCRRRIRLRAHASMVS